MSAPEHLVVAVTAPLRLELRTGRVSGAITVGGRVFYDIGLGDWIGFYDWLRAGNGEIVGVRSWLEGPELKRVLEALLTKESCNWVNARGTNFLFLVQELRSVEIM